MAENKRRTVVLILCDSLRPDFLTAYGADIMPTPNIDALAANGATFENSITASTVCAPARASIVTGKFVSGHDGWTNNIPLPEDTEYFPMRLDEAGYMTAAVGCYDHAPFGSTLGYRYLRRCDENRPGTEYYNYIMEKHPDATRAFMGDGFHLNKPAYTMLTDALRACTVPYETEEEK